MRKQSVVLYGPQGCGKTVNGAAIAKALGLKAVVELDEVSRDNMPKARGSLYLTCRDKADLQHYEKLGLRLMAYEAAIRLPGFKRTACVVVGSGTVELELDGHPLKINVGAIPQ